jgi:hypothetical protein
MRRVEREILDELPAEDPRARRSRRDLQRINLWMGHARIWVKRLSRLPYCPTSILELGAGDGTLFLKVARRLPHSWRGASLKLMDRRELVTPETLAEFARLGWEAEVMQADVEQLSSVPPLQLVTANLFLHHFEEPALRQLFQRLSDNTRAFAACEPRRLAQPKWAGWLVGLTGGSSVTRHDAVVSVRAGFCGQELSRLWPHASGWALEEGAAGLFSHFFLAQRL